MTIEVRLLRNFYAGGIEESVLKPNNPPDFKSWINSGVYTVVAVPSKDEFSLHIRDYVAFSSMLSHDASRMSSASFESVKSIRYQEDMPKSLAWAAIQSYYAAFFSAHAILRFFGYVCSYLERGHVVTLDQYASLQGLDGVLKYAAGYFCGTYDNVSNQLNLKRLRNTHEDTWKLLSSLLESLSQDVLEVQGLGTKKQEISSYLSDLKLCLSNRGRHSSEAWLSYVRNSVNYRQEHGAWYPHGNQQEAVERVMRLISMWCVKDSSIFNSISPKSDLEFFFEACSRVVNFHYVLLGDLCSISKSSNGCFERLPKRFLETYSDQRV